MLLKNTPAPELDGRDASGSTPLIIAGKLSNTVDSSSGQKLTFVTSCAASVSAGQESNVVALIAAGANVNATNEKGQGPLSARCFHPSQRNL
jgi:hypothetical protein